MIFFFKMDPGIIPLNIRMLLKYDLYIAYSAMDKMSVSHIVQC